MAALSCCLTPEEQDQRNTSHAIDKELSKQKAYLRREIKVLLLGAGESGKSTFLKQMKIIHGQEFSDEEIREFRTIIYNNIIKGLKVLSDARDKLGIEWGDPENQQHAARIMGCDNSVTVDPGAFVNYVNSAKSLWKDQGIQNAYDRRREFQLADSVKYFLDDVDRIGQRDYEPIRADILHARKATRGIHEHVIEIPNKNGPTVPFRFVDVGGQRSERMKWYQCFSRVTAIIFLGSSSEYDQNLMEDRVTSRMVESVNIFDTIVNHTYFRKVALILFLNKSDLLKEKVEKGVLINKWFPGYKGDPTKLEDVQSFILAMYDARRKDRSKDFFHHFTTAVDTNNIKRIFDGVHAIILKKNVDDALGAGAADDGLPY